MVTQNSNSHETHQKSFFGTLFVKKLLPAPKKRNYFAKYKKNVSRGVAIIFSGGVVVAVVANIWSVYRLPSLYHRVANEDRQSLIEALKLTRSLPEFDTFMQRESPVSPEIKLGVFANDAQRKDEIIKLEAALEKNNSSRDVLYALYVLYKEQGDETKANDYFQKTKAIDPFVSEITL